MNKHMCKISVAMTTYNGEKYIRGQIESLMKQSRLPDEIIISDDASNDNTIDIVSAVFNEYQYQNYKILKNKTNLGYKKNFYQSIANTNGDIIFLCDQDDLWLEDKIEVFEKLFLDNGMALSINGSFVLIDAEDKILDYICHRGFVNNDLLKGHYPEKQITKVSYDTVLRYNISPGCTMAFRREIKDIFLEGSTHELPHDWEINLLAAMKGGLFFYNSPVIQYRIHEKNTLGMNTDDSISQFEFKDNIDFRKAAIMDRIVLKNAATYWIKKAKGSIEQKKVLQRIIRYDESRRKCVFEHKITSWFCLVFWTIFLWDGKHVRFKTLLGDFYYVVKNK